MKVDLFSKQWTSYLFVPIIIDAITKYYDCS